MCARDGEDMWAVEEGKRSIESGATVAVVAARLPAPGQHGLRFPGWPAHPLQWAALSLAAIALTALTALTYRALDQQLTDAVMSRRVAVAQLMATTVSATFDRLADLSVSLASRVRFRDLVHAGRWTEAMDILRGVPADFRFIERLFITDANGILMADLPEAAGVRGQSFAHRDWYKGVSAGRTAYLSPVYERSASPQINVFAVAAPITRSDGSLSGFLVLQFRSATFLEWIGGIDLGSDGLAYVTDSRGQIAFHSRLPATAEIQDISALPIVQRLRRGERGVEVHVDPLVKQESVSAYAPVARYGWGIIAQQPARTAFAARDDQLRRLLAGYALILLLFAGIAYLTFRIAMQRREATEHLKVKAELERLVSERTARLEVVNKELESFSYSVSHDLRSPLRAIVGFAKMLEEDYARILDEEGRRLLKVIQDNSRRMGQLIDDLLAFSRLGRKPLAAARVDMNEQVRTTIAELMAGTSCVRFDVTPLPDAMGDAALLKQVWTNLISNAIKFSGKRDQPVVAVSGEARIDGNVYCVKDNGVGFDMEYYNKLFGVFQRLHSADQYPGTGVGLAIVQRVVSRHGGRVWAEGKEDEGAAFYFSLPSGPSGDGRHVGATASGTET